MAVPQLEEGAAFAVVGLAVINTMSLYRDAAPKLSELRNTSRDDFKCRQMMMDADFFGGLAVVLIGGTAALLTRRLYPLVIEAVYVKLDLIAMWQKNATDIVTNMTAQFKDHPILSMFGS
jgi:hypothetical protein